MLIITLVSLVVAVVAVGFAWRVTQEAQRRSDARVALLMAELSAPSPTNAATSAESEPDHQDAAEDEPTVAEIAAPPVGEQGPQGDAVASVSNLFAQQQAAEPAQVVPRWALVVGVAVLVGVGLIALSALSSMSGARPTTEVQASATAPPLELLALEHEQEGETVVVSGLVRNPTAAAARRELAAVILFFDTQGRTLARTAALVEVAALGPGTRSPFTVRAPLPAGASRLRVSFRQDDGSAVPHVDLRRAGGTP